MKRLIAAAAALSTLAAPVLASAQEHEHEHEHHGGGPRGAPQGQSQAAPQGGAQPQFQQRPQFQGGGQPQFQGRPQFQGGGQPQFQGRPQFQGGGQPQFQGGQPQFQGGRPEFHGGQGGYRPQGGAQPQFQQGGAQPQFQGRPQFPGGQGGYRPQGQFQGGYQGGYHPGFQGRPGDFNRDRDHDGYYRGGRAGGQPFSYGGRSFFRYRAEPYRFPAQYRGWEHHYWRRGEFLPSFFFLPNYYIEDWYDFGLWEPSYGFQWIRVGADALLINLATGEVVDSVPGVYYY